MPTEELRRLDQLLGRTPRQLSRASEAFQGGYREGWIRCPIGGRWNLQLPGWLRASCDDADGHDVYWDDRMTVHVTARSAKPHIFSISQAVERHLRLLSAKQREHAQVERIDNGEVHGYAVLLTSDTESNEPAVVQGQVAYGNERVTFTVVIRSPEGCDMALRLGRSLTIV